MLQEEKKQQLLTVKIQTKILMSNPILSLRKNKIIIQEVISKNKQEQKNSSQVLRIRPIVEIKNLYGLFFAK